jgi:hypothetical protein
MIRALTLSEIAQALDNLIDAGYGDCRVYVRDYWVQEDEIKIVRLAGIDYVCIGDA